MQNQMTRPDTPSAIGLSEAELTALPRARRGPVRRPVPKVQLTLRLSQTLIDQLKSTGPGWITRLEQHMEQWVQQPKTKA